MNIKKLNEELNKLLEEHSINDTYDGFYIEVMPEGKEIYDEDGNVISHGVALYSSSYTDEDYIRYHLINAGPDAPYTFIDRKITDFNTALKVGLELTFDAFPNTDCETDYETVEKSKWMSYEDREEEDFEIVNLCRGRIYDTTIGDNKQYLGVLYIMGIIKL